MKQWSLIRFNLIRFRYASAILFISLKRKSNWSCANTDPTAFFPMQDLFNKSALSYEIGHLKIIDWF